MTAGISKKIAIVLAALCLPLAACSEGPAAKGGIVLGGKGGAKAKAAAAWMDGPAAKNKVVVGGEVGAKKKLGGGGGGGVKIPKIGAGFAKGKKAKRG